MIDIRKLFFSISLLAIAGMSSGQPISSARPTTQQAQPTLFTHDFAPSDDFIKPQEHPYREAICLNGSWSFFPVENAEKLSRESILHPELPAHPVPDPVPVKVPSPWNVNSFARGNGSGGDFVTYPSYPKKWETIKAGWLMRKITYRKEWKDKRLVLRFEAVDGYTQVFVNGRKAGENKDIFLPFELDITGLLKEGADNELWVWVADASLLNQPGKYGRRTYVAGSFWGQHARGIWQDVNLVITPAVAIENTFIKPELDKDTLSVEITLANTTDQARELTVSGTLSPWINQAGKTISEAPEPKWTSGPEVLSLTATRIKIAPRSRASITLRVRAGNKLTPWSPEAPALYGLLVTAEARSAEQPGKSSDNGTSADAKETTTDKKYTRFGWRQFTINGDKFYLNGKPIRLKGDSWHFMGIPQMTRRYAWAWFSALKDCHANAVRLHAQPYPEFYMDMADEMGICVLDETGIWASDGGPKVDAEEYWTSCNEHVERLVLRDRNHPSVFGWSICNENLAVVIGVMHAPDPLVKRQVAQINKWIGIVKRTDPTRPWISGDGETNLPTDLPIVIGHYGGEDSYKSWSTQGKVWGIGEGGMAYYGTPRQTAVYNGNRSYESQLGRMEGVAKEATRLLTMQNSYGASYSSVFNIAWYALQPLELGLKDTTRMPQPSDGIFFSPYQEGRPGIQPERLGPYTTTFNPGYDPSLPLYRTWPLADAIRNAFSDSAASAPASAAGTHNASSASSVAVTMPVAYTILLSTDKDSLLSRLLTEMGIDIRPTPAGKKGRTTDNGQGLTPDKGRGLLIIDGLHAPEAKKYLSLLHTISESGGVILVWGADPASAARLNEYLPQPLELTNRKATSFLIKTPDPMLNGLGSADFYFSELSDNPVMNFGLAGDFTRNGNVLLEACNTDWRTWNGRAEYLKTAAVLRSEREYKPEGAVLVSQHAGKGTIYVLTLDPAVLSKTSVGILRKLFINLGVSFQNTGRNNTPAIDQQGRLQQALLLASFDITGRSNEEIRTIDLLKDNKEDQFFAGRQMNDRYWEKATAQDGVFDFTKLSFTGPSQNAIAYLSFWLYSPRSLSNLLIEPDMPRVDMLVSADDGCQIYLNRKLFHESFTGSFNAKGDTVRGLPLEKGWNHVLVKAIQKAGGWKLALGLDSDNKEFLKEIKSQIAR
jgi:hypothetical protein